MNIDEAYDSVDNPDPVVAIRAVLVCTTQKSECSIGFRNGLRFAIAILTGKEPKYESNYSKRSERQ